MQLDEASVLALERPHRKLLTYYTLTSFFLGPLFPALLLPRLLRYHTLRYRFDNEGVSMRWGMLFRREISLTYTRIQDIHLTSNFIERWLGLARVKVQTASGSAEAEMTVEGIPEYELVRDFLYNRMRGVTPGVRRDDPARVADPQGPALELATSQPDELTRILGDVAAELRAIRSLLQNSPRGD